MSNNPYDQARDDARSGRGLTPGADEGVYWAERRAREENQRIKDELEQRGKPGSPEGQATVMAWINSHLRPGVDPIP